MELGHTQVLSPPRRGAAGGSVMMLPTPQPIPSPPKSGCAILGVYRRRTKQICTVGDDMTGHDIVEIATLTMLGIVIIHLAVGWIQDHINIK